MISKMEELFLILLGLSNIFLRNSLVVVYIYAIFRKATNIKTTRM